METSDPQIRNIEEETATVIESPEKSALELAVPEVNLDIEIPPSPAAKKRGRPPGSKNRVKQPPVSESGHPRDAVYSPSLQPQVPPPSPVNQGNALPTVEDVANVMLDMLQERQATRRNAKRQLYRSFLEL